MPTAGHVIQFASNRQEICFSMCIAAPFGFSSTAAAVAQDIDLSDKRVITTGASSGIGIETARTLAQIGAEVTLPVRNAEAGDAAIRR